MTDDCSSPGRYCMAGLGLVLFAAGQSMPIIPPGPCRHQLRRAAALLQRAGDLARPRRNRVRVRRRHLDGPSRGRRRAAARLARGERVAAALLARRRSPRVRFGPHRRRRHLRADARRPGALTQLTFDDGLERLDAWSRDGQWLYFSSTSRDIAGMNDLYRVRADGGTPMQVSADRYTSEFFAAPSPDGQRVAFTARGNSAGQWWRKGHSHLDESEIWLLAPTSQRPRPIRAPHRARREADVADVERRRQEPLLHVRSRAARRTSGRCRSAARPRQVTQFTDGRVLWPTISYDGRTIVFERDFEIWKLDTGERSGAARSPITQRGVPPAPATEHLTLNNRFQDLALSPDGRKVAFVARGEILAARRATAATPSASRAATRASRRSSGRPTAAASSTSRSATASRTFPLRLRDAAARRS